jgi:hypothetical protein
MVRSRCRREKSGEEQMKKREEWRGADEEERRVARSR